MRPPPLQTYLKLKARDFSHFRVSGLPFSKCRIPWNAIWFSGRTVDASNLSQLVSDYPFNLTLLWISGAPDARVNRQNVYSGLTARLVE
jgi:hypothetical protein